MNQDNNHMLPLEITSIIDKFVDDIRHIQIDPKRGRINSEYAIQVWKYLCDSINYMNQDQLNELTEIERQKTDLEHFLTDPKDCEKDEDEILQEIATCIRKRRFLKDSSTLTHILAQNISRNVGFIKGMLDRQYTPRSEKYGDPDVLEASSEETTMKVEDIAVTRQRPRYIK